MMCFIRIKHGSLSLQGQKTGQAVQKESKRKTVIRANGSVG